jgi:hypothetical protein
VKGIFFPSRAAIDFVLIFGFFIVVYEGQGAAALLSLGGV